ncbi:MAG: helix-turn-helix domain containing protein, partial [Azoarcus sp.]|nr:helix-turn-helix domain containing protein [Azoarcus sp.]
MTGFSEKLLRLKQQLGVTTDKEAAELLGLQEKAFNARKRRNSFPETELYALAAKRPELGINVDCVLTGITRHSHARLATERAEAERGIPFFITDDGPMEVP